MRTQTSTITPGHMCLDMYRHPQSCTNTWGHRCVCPDTQHRPEPSHGNALVPRHGPAHMQAHTCTRAVCHPDFPIQGLCKHHNGTQSLVPTRGAWISTHICKLLWNREEAETRPSSYRQQRDVTGAPGFRVNPSSAT